MKKHKWMSLPLPFFWFICAACGPLPPGKVRLVSQQMPPTFEFKGFRPVLFVYFEGPFLADRDGTVAPHDVIDSMWPNQIWKIHGPFGVTTLNEVPPISYGQLPPGWEQNIPKTSAPPPLIEGKVYHVGANLDEGRRINMCFLIRDGKAQVYHGKYNRIDCDEE